MDDVDGGDGGPWERLSKRSVRKEGRSKGDISIFI